MPPVLIIGTVLTCISVLLGQSELRPLAKNVTVTITPAKATLFAGEMQTFVATVIGVDDKTVTWGVEEEEEDGGTISELGQYTAPKIQGMYHIIATSRSQPQIKGVATVTVLTYCDPLPSALRRQR